MALRSKRRRSIDSLAEAKEFDLPPWTPKDRADIRFHDLAPFFIAPFNVVSAHINICGTVLKKICRKIGIPRWPHRKWRSLQRMIVAAELKLQQAEALGQDTTSILAQLTELRMNQEKLMTVPSEPSFPKAPRDATSANLTFRYWEPNTRSRYSLVPLEGAAEPGGRPTMLAPQHLTSYGAHESRSLPTSPVGSPRGDRRRYYDDSHHASHFPPAPSAFPAMPPFMPTSRFNDDVSRSLPTSPVSSPRHRPIPYDRYDTAPAPAYRSAFPSGLLQVQSMPCSPVGSPLASPAHSPTPSPRRSADIRALLNHSHGSQTSQPRWTPSGGSPFSQPDPYRQPPSPFSQEQPGASAGLLQKQLEALHSMQQLQKLQDETEREADRKPKADVAMRLEADIAEMQLDHTDEEMGEVGDGRLPPISSILASIGQGPGAGGQ